MIGGKKTKEHINKKKKEKKSQILVLGYLSLPQTIDRKECYMKTIHLSLSMDLINCY